MTGDVISLAIRRFRRCHRKGHDWFPDLDRREFLPVQDICQRCGAKRTKLPYGQCLSGDHRIAEHYHQSGLDLQPHAVGECPWPR